MWSFLPINKNLQLSPLVPPSGIFLTNYFRNVTRKMEVNGGSTIPDQKQSLFYKKNAFPHVPGKALRVDYVKLSRFFVIIIRYSMIDMRTDIAEVK